MIFDHVNIKAPKDEIEKECQFLCDMLSLKPGYRPNFSDEGYWLYHKDKAVIHLSIDEQKLRTDNHSNFDHIAFSHDDFDELSQKLTQNNIDFKIDYFSVTNITQVKFFSHLNIKFEIQFEGDKT